MAEDLKVTPLSQSIATEIARQMREQHIRPMELERMLEGKVNMYAIRRIRKGASGCYLRSYEQILDALGIKLIPISKHHPDVIE